MKHRTDLTDRMAWVFALCTLCVAGCGAREPATSASVTGSASAPAAAPVRDTQRMVGYDVRRIRPGDTSLEAAFERGRVAAVSDGRHVAVLFSADWCQPCRDLELELGNLHPASAIEDVRILMLKEEEWQKAVRMDEFNGLRARWDKVLNRYPLFVFLDENGVMIEEMQAGREAMEAEGIAATLPSWFARLRARGWTTSAGAAGESVAAP